MRGVVRLPGVRLQAIIVVCAYIGYKGIDDYSLSAVQAYGMDEVQGAKVSALSAWVRPIAAVGAGWLLDRSPGVAGHQHFFMFLAASAAIGLLASTAFRRHARPSQTVARMHPVR